uniref:Short transient receptor potential channel 2-like n=1 Tax=Scleropages formosus TaxID=113540 RepID=A0A8C9WH04_SCLFO
MTVLSMYLASFTLRLLEPHLCRFIAERDHWHQEDPQLISELLFAVTSMMSFTRLAYILPAHESLGTLQISIGKMIDDMMRFMFILMIIGTAFLCGVNNVYVPYINTPYLGRFNETFRFLFWTMFGVVNQGYVDMPEYLLAEFVGRILYGIYTLIIVIVLLNMLIAMITNSFQKIEDDADVEWKFARSKLYLSYFREGLTMPVPFNIIPSPKSLVYLLRGIVKQLCCCCNVSKPPDYPPIASMVGEQNGKLEESRVPYRLQVIKALVQRYIEAARREFEETKRKDVGNRITELSKTVGRLHSEMKYIHKSLQTTATKTEEDDILRKYIAGAKNNFKGFDNKAAMGLNIDCSVERRDIGEIQQREDTEEEGSPEPHETFSPAHSESSVDTGLGSQREEEIQPPECVYTKLLINVYTFVHQSQFYFNNISELNNGTL